MSDPKKKVDIYSSKLSVFSVAKHALLFIVLLYLVWSAYEISTLKSEVRDLSRILASMHSPESKDIATNSVELFSTVGVVEEVERLRLRRSVNKDKKPRNKPRKKRRRNRPRRCKCPAGPQGPRGEKGQMGSPGVQGAPGNIKAAHFVTNPPNTRDCILDENTFYCPTNKTFWSSEKNALIPYFQEAEWMKNKHLNLIMRQNTDRSSFEVLQAGLYLLYVQIEKFTKDPREYFGLFVSDKRVFHCADSIDKYQPSEISEFFNAKEKTCNMMGLHYLNKGDIVQIKILTRSTSVSLSHDKTFFGAILFS